MKNSSDTTRVFEKIGAAGAAMEREDITTVGPVCPQGFVLSEATIAAPVQCPYCGDAGSEEWFRTHVHPCPCCGANPCVCDGLVQTQTDDSYWDRVDAAYSLYKDGVL